MSETPINRDIYRYDPDVGQTFIPDLKARMAHESGGYLVRTNGQGFRSDHNFSRPKGAARRILLFGDSFTAGDGVSNKNRYSDILEKQLADTEIFNFGISSTGTDQQYLIYRKFAREIDADLIVIAVLVENIRRNVSRYRRVHDKTGRMLWKAKPYFTLENGTLVRGHDPVPTELLTDDQINDFSEANADRGGRFVAGRKLVNKLGLKELVQKATRYQPVAEYDSADNPAWQLTAALLRQWKSELTVPVVLMPLPLYQHVEEAASAGAYQERFAELAVECGFALHDPLEDLRSYTTEERRNFRFQTDVHLTPAGHAALAKSLEPALSLG